MTAGGDDERDPQAADTTPDSAVAVRPATADDSLAVRRLLDAALLEHDDLEERIDAEAVIVAVESVDGADGDPAPDGSDDRVHGAVVLESRTRAAGDAGDGDDAARTTRVAAIAVRKRRRARGVGTALIRAAADRDGPLTARFDARVRPFYEALGFEIERIGEERYEGVLRTGACE